MDPVQPGIAAALPSQARHLFFSTMPGTDIAAALTSLRVLLDGEAEGRTVVGIGKSSAAALGKSIEGLRAFPVHDGPGFSVPATPMALWVWLRDDDRGSLVHRARAVEAAVGSAFFLQEVVDCFRYGENQDLSGYIDGTENPEGEEALVAAFVRGAGPGKDGGSYVAIQRWVHQLDLLEELTEAQRDLMIGRRISDNEEIDDAPDSAHVKRTAQETFEPEAFVLRRSMPWADASEEGLLFVAFGRSVDAFEAQLNRMVGAEDGVVDALFSFTQPVTGSYFWCPPLSDGRLDLTALGL